MTGGACFVRLCSSRIWSGAEQSVAGVQERGLLQCQGKH